MLTCNRPDGYPFVVFLNKLGKGDIWIKMIDIDQVVNDMPPCLDVVIESKRNGQWVIVYCRDEATCIMIAMEFQSHFDGHMVERNGKVVRLSEPLLSRYHEDRSLRSQAANDS